MSTTPIKDAPEGVKFYYPEPADLEGEGEHGDVIWRRELTNRAAVRPTDGSPPWHNELVLYRSLDVHGNPIAVSGIIVLPSGPAPEGGYPVISWAHGTVGSADPCAPSRDEDPDAQPHNAYPHALLREFLKRGWAVVMTDYEGLGTKGPHPYMLGESEARGILDIVRAARQLYPQIGRRFQIVGHSQGGQAALFGAHHAPTWTPELELCGVAAVAPASSITDLVLLGTASTAADGGNAFTGLFLTGAMGGDPSIDPAELLTPDAFKVYPHLEQRARAGLSKTDSWGGLAGTNQLQAGSNPSKHAFYRQLERMHPALPIAAPIRITQAAADQRVNATFTLKLVQQLRFLNGENRVEYRFYPAGSGVPATDNPDELGYHFGTIEKDMPEMLQWLAARFHQR